MKSKIMKNILVGLTIFNLFGCEIGLKSDKVNNFVNELGKNPDEVAKVKTTVIEDEESINQENIIEINNIPSGVETYAKYVKCETTGGIDELNNYGQYDDQLYPGAVVDISKPAISNIPLEQSSRTLSISLESVAKNDVYRPYVMSEPSLSAARVGVNKLVSTTKDRLTEYPVKLNMKIKEASNSQELKLALGVSGSYSGFEIKDEFDYSTSYSSKSILLILTQNYYTIDVDSKTHASQYFSSNLSDEVITKGLEGTIPAIVSSVTYGRVAVVRLTSKKSIQSLSNKLNGRYNNGVLSAELTNEISSKIESKELSTEIMIYGGTVSNGEFLGENMNFDDLIKEFSKDICPDVAAALPISYRLRYISDFSLAKIMMTNEPIYQKIYYQRYSPLRVYLHSIEFITKNKNNENDFFNELNKIYIQNLKLNVLYSMFNEKSKESIYSQEIDLDASRVIKNKRFNKGVAEFEGVFSELIVDNKTLELAIYDKLEVSIDLKLRYEYNEADKFLDFISLDFKSLFSKIFNNSGQYIVDKTPVVTNAENTNLLTISEEFYVEAYSSDDAQIRFKMSSKYLY